MTALFQKKLTINGGFKTSPFWLNGSISSNTEWNKQTIEKRSEALAARAIDV
ncbi:hypothetical protein JCM9152_4345 [Halalkalibacter hemicellulosilyticusJCM 9152]|uniref:Uncharacterized protein n=1 Tax=Halalkalibacter hemicellulosilyticusJCM 9152 TaxID=1236971 RepID=W4QKX9_9BACI|nr:hypothetical protein JCM9152_4345 [Halalkalibacter hemicellulosilyticusJCM 9152]